MRHESVFGDVCAGVWIHEYDACARISIHVVVFHWGRGGRILFCVFSSCIGTHVRGCPHGVRITGRSAILEEVRGSQCVIIVGETGSGKTTR